MKNLDAMLEKRRKLNAAKSVGEDVADEIRANEKLIREARKNGARSSVKRTRRAAPVSVSEAGPTKRTRKATPKSDDTPEPAGSRKRKARPVVDSTTHSDVDITSEPTPDPTGKVDDRPADVIAAEAAWRTSRGPDGTPTHGSAYTMLKYAELEVVRLNHAIAKLKKQVMRDPKAAGIIL